MNHLQNGLHDTSLTTLNYLFSERYLVSSQHTHARTHGHTHAQI